jgi:hypothetical protein
MRSAFGYDCVLPTFCTWLLKMATFCGSRSKLTIYLPHKVDEHKSNAKWDAAKEELRITLRIIKEMELGD